MRKLLLFAFLAVNGFASAQIVNIPDPAFKARLLQYGTALDANEDGEIQVSEASSFTLPLSLGASYSNPGEITDVTGIEAFTNITQFYADYNEITLMDLSSNVMLEEVVAGYNNLTSINVSNCPNLTTLTCYNNQLTAIDVSNCTNLTDLKVNHNLLESIDVSGNVNLEKLWASNNSLTAIDVSNNTALIQLEVSYNNLTNLDITNNTLISLFSCNGNQLTSLDITNNQYITSLLCGDNNISELDVSNNPNITEIACHENNLSTIDLSQVPNLITLTCAQNPFISLDFSNNPLLHTLTIAQTTIPELDLSNNPALTVLYCISNYDLTYINLKSGSNENISLEYSGFGWSSALETVCIDDINSPLANFIQSEVTHFVEFTETCTDTASTDSFAENKFTVYPNPAYNELYINSPNAIQNTGIYNMLGQEVLTARGNTVIDISGLSSGTYLVKVTDNQGNSSVQRILKK